MDSVVMKFRGLTAQVFCQQLILALFVIWLAFKITTTVIKDICFPDVIFRRLLFESCRLCLVDFSVCFCYSY